MHRYFIELAYNGSEYNGWQTQPNAPSVQEAINKALTLLLKQEINVTGAGRTDVLRSNEKPSVLSSANVNLVPAVSAVWCYMERGCCKSR